MGAAIHSRYIDLDVCWPYFWSPTLASLLSSSRRTSTWKANGLCFSFTSQLIVTEMASSMKTTGNYCNLLATKAITRMFLVQHPLRDWSHSLTANLVFFVLDVNAATWSFNQGRRKPWVSQKEAYMTVIGGKNKLAGCCSNCDQTNISKINVSIY